MFNVAPLHNDKLSQQLWCDHVFSLLSRHNGTVSFADLLLMSGLGEDKQQLCYDLLVQDDRFAKVKTGMWRAVPWSYFYPNQSLAQTPFAVVDLEASGQSDQYENKIVEVAGVKLRGGEIIDTFSSLVNTGGVPMTKYVAEMTGITDSMLESAPQFPEIMLALREFLRGSVFVAHNAYFDACFLNFEISRLEREDNFSIGYPLCTQELAKVILKRERGLSLAGLSEYLGYDLKPHRALADAEATAHLLDHMLQLAQREQNIGDLDGLLALQYSCDRSNSFRRKISKQKRRLALQRRSQSDD